MHYFEQTENSLYYHVKIYSMIWKDIHIQFIHYALTSFIFRKSRVGRSSSWRRFKRHFLICKSQGWDRQRWTRGRLGDEGVEWVWLGITGMEPAMSVRLTVGVGWEEEPKGSSIDRLRNLNSKRWPAPWHNNGWLSLSNQGEFREPWDPPS